VVVDFGAIVEGTAPTLTRTFCVGAPSETAQRMVDVVAVEASRPAWTRCGPASREGHRRRLPGRHSPTRLGRRFLHSTGHGVGLEIHEDPRVASTSTDTLVAGHVVTVEPGVYLPSTGGVRIEDTMVVTAEGCTVLTKRPKEIVVA